MRFSLVYEYVYIYRPTVLSSLHFGDQGRGNQGGKYTRPSAWTPAQLEDSKPWAQAVPRHFQEIGKPVGLKI